MSLPKTLETFMQDNHIHYQNILHERTPNALANVAKIHCRTRDMAKVVACWVDDGMALFVLPANEKMHISTLKERIGAKHISMLTEDEMGRVFSDCEVGAQPPFGSMYSMPTFMSSHFGSHYSMFFNGGTHTDVVQMPIDEFKLVENPFIVDFSVPYNQYEEYLESYLLMK